jgi:hypothetical protein
MHSFAFVFRSGPALGAAELSKRNAAAREWALALQRDGRLLAASPLEDGGAVVSQRGVAPVPAERPVASVLVIEAADLASAVELAKGHPGLVYGTEIEIRPVKAVPR